MNIVTMMLKTGSAMLLMIHLEYSIVCFSLFMIGGKT